MPQPKSVLTIGLPLDVAWLWPRRTPLRKIAARGLAAQDVL